MKRALKARDGTSSLSKTLKLVRQLSTTVHSADLFAELSHRIQVELYAYGNTKLFSLLSRNQQLFEFYSLYLRLMMK